MNGSGSRSHFPCSFFLGIVLFVAAATPAGADTVRLLSFNAWHAGTQVDDGPRKIVDAVVASGADVVAFQESEGRAALDVAAALGWHALQGPASVAIVSRFPVVEAFAMARDASALGARLRISEAPARDIVVWSAHLAYEQYGPYAACDGDSDAALRAAENRTGRRRQARDILRRMRRQFEQADEVPIFLLGDFNSPSHLDWTPEATSAHCGRSFAWPVSSMLVAAGLRDAFREVHPDPVSEPGFTWSPVFPDPEPQDRIDFVHVAGAGAEPVSATTFVVGTPLASPDHESNEWPSDHAGVLVEFEVEPTAAFEGSPPSLSLDRASYGAGDPIVVDVAGGPGNRDDWVGFFPAGVSPADASPDEWLYLSGRKRAGGRRAEATLTFPAGTLAAGTWRAHFLYADGDGGLAAPVEFEVTD